METVKHFCKNFNRFRSGDIEHEETSSVTIKKLMFSLNFWIVPLRGQSWLRISLSPAVYIISFMINFSGHPRTADIPNWGKFIDIVAGAYMSMTKLCFLYWKRHQITDLISLMNEKSQVLRARGKLEPSVKKLRDAAYVQEMFVMIFTVFFGPFFLVIIFVQVLFLTPFQLVIPMAFSFTGDLIDGNHSLYWPIYVVQYYLCLFVAVVLTLCDMMVGNIYNQLILHLEVLNHDFQKLSEARNLTESHLVGKLCELARTYQTLRKINDQCEICMRPFFVNNVVATILATTFSCVEVGIMINVDPSKCIKPFMYFLFICFPFFYWCWLGNRLSEQSSGLAIAVYTYNERVSTVFAQKLQLVFTHQVQQPITIKARPFFVLNFDIFVRVMRVAYQFTAVFRNFYKMQNH